MLWGGKRTYWNLAAIYFKLMKKKMDRIRLDASLHSRESNVFLQGKQTDTRNSVRKQRKRKEKLRRGRKLREIQPKK